MGGGGRTEKGQSPDEPKQRLSLHDKVPARKYIEDINHHVVKNGRRFRALGSIGKDLELLRAISAPAYIISGLTNKILRQALSAISFGTGRTDKQISGKISRHLRLLRTHGLIRKIPRQNRYQVTLRGVRLLNILNAFWAASTENLMKIAA